jgi:hypothetical protein
MTYTSCFLVMVFVDPKGSSVQTMLSCLIVPAAFGSINLNVCGN